MIFRLLFVGLFVTIFGLACSVEKAYARGGGDISGGGGSCYRPDLLSYPFLLDYAGHVHLLAKTPVTSETIPIDEKVRRLGYRPLGLKKLKAYAYLQERLKLWSDARTKEHIDRIEHVATSLSFFGTAYSISLKSIIFPKTSKVCSGENVQTLALYNDSHVVISLGEWNKLDIVSQAGLLLHELLRHIQITHNKNYNSELETELRDIVAHIMLMKPGADPAFDLAAKEAFFSKNFFKRLPDVHNFQAAVCPYFEKMSDNDILLLEKISRTSREKDCRKTVAGLPTEEEARGLYDVACLILNDKLKDSQAKDYEAADKLLNSLGRFNTLKTRNPAIWRNAVGRVCRPIQRQYEIDELIDASRIIVNHLAGLSPFLSSRYIWNQMGENLDNHFDMIDRTFDTTQVALDVALQLGDFSMSRNNVVYDDLARALGGITKKMSSGWIFLEVMINDYFDGKLDTKKLNEQQKKELQAGMEALVDMLNTLFKTMLDSNLVADPGYQLEKIQSQAR